MCSSNRLSLVDIEQKVKRLSALGSSETSTNTVLNSIPIPYDTGNAETKYEPVPNEEEEGMNKDTDESLQEYPVPFDLVDEEITDTIIEDEEEEKLQPLPTPIEPVEEAKEPVVPKEDRKNLSYAEDKSLVYYDRETLNEEDRNTMLQAIEQHILTPQYDRSGNLYFNPNGTVSRAESINALEVNGHKGLSIDGRSKESDYYNSGYNELIPSNTSNFYHLYSKEDLYGNIRRCELAYMMSSHTGYDFGSDYEMSQFVGALLSYEDMKKIQLTLDKANEVDNLIPVDHESIEDYFDKVRKGIVRLPISLMILTHMLVDLGYSKADEKLKNLHPLKGLSRLEFSKYVVKLKQGL
ncbi:hypothetical protein P9X10_00665 [Bacillus cereus]|nr:hypothetical protein [Bacillus cereus]